MNPAPDPTNPSWLLYAGITALAGVVVLLWRIVIAHNLKCETDNKKMAEENAKMAEHILALTEKVGIVSGQHMAICSVLRGCPVPGCTLSKHELLKQ